MENDLIHITFEQYELIFAQWCIETYGHIAKDHKAMYVFDNRIGLELDTDDLEYVTGHKFKIINKKKFMIAKLKYGF
jgi:hypothetical protein